jgi:hypothetical protein
MVSSLRLLDILYRNLIRQVAGGKVFEALRSPELQIQDIIFLQYEYNRVSISHFGEEELFKMYYKHDELGVTNFYSNVIFICLRRRCVRPYILR